MDEVLDEMALEDARNALDALIDAADVLQIDIARSLWKTGRVSAALRARLSAFEDCALALGVVIPAGEC